ncbi:Glycosyl hydrolase family 61 [Rhizoctonia solani]|uniref:AA9 family lytic polysaccharide monooxygenase n=1 Tax=Rhizoctonia solani TaxID=456999 RepID=A0A8H7I543_9AGAM|nr:Glycosyl hydrolase family 61 [Rhizoctonia solani]
MYKLSALAVLLAQVGSIVAHGGVVSIGIGGTKYQGWQPYNSPSGQVTAGRPYSSFDPILSPTASTIHCNNNGESGPSQQTLTIAAGTNITSYYTQWTHAEGPYTVYLAACPRAGAPGLVLQASLGLKSANRASSVALSIPSNLKAGYYLIRWETLALHQANTPQFYPECAQLQVTGGGSTVPTSDYLVKIPGAWKASDPGVTIDIYSTAAQTQTTYVIPGPRIYPDSDPPVKLSPGALRDLQNLMQCIDEADTHECGF